MGKPGGGHAPSSRSECIAPWKRTGGSEPSQYPQEEKANAIPSVAASESGTSPNRKGVIARRRCLSGVAGRGVVRLRPDRRVTNHQPSRRSLEWAAIEGESPVSERFGDSLVALPSTTGHEKPRGNPGGPSPKAKYSSATDSEPVP